MASTKIKIGITGGIGSGKSLASEILNSLGYPVFNSDDAAKELMVKDANLIADIKLIFGDESYINKELNNVYLAGKIFSNPALREKLNALVHPLVQSTFNKWVEEQETVLVFNEAAIIFETGSYRHFDYTLLITADEHLRIKRVIDRDNTTVEHVKNRMKSQWSDDKKKELASFIIENNGEKEALLPKLMAVVETIKLKEELL